MSPYLASERDDDGRIHFTMPSLTGAQIISWASLICVAMITVVPGLAIFALAMFDRLFSDVATQKWNEQETVLAQVPEDDEPGVQGPPVLLVAPFLITPHSAVIGTAAHASERLTGAVLHERSQR